MQELQLHRHKDEPKHKQTQVHPTPIHLQLMATSNGGICLKGILGRQVGGVPLGNPANSTAEQIVLFLVGVHDGSGGFFYQGYQKEESMRGSSQFPMVLVLETKSNITITMGKQEEDNETRPSLL